MFDEGTERQQEQQGGRRYPLHNVHDGLNTHANTKHHVHSFSSSLQSRARALRVSQVSLRSPSLSPRRRTRILLSFPHSSSVSLSLVLTRLGMAHTHTHTRAHTHWVLSIHPSPLRTAGLNAELPGTAVVSSVFNNTESTNSVRFRVL